MGTSRSSSSEWTASLQRNLPVNPEAGDPKEAAPRREDHHRCCCHHLYCRCETPPDAATEEAGEGAPACPLPPPPPPGPRRFIENHSHVTVWHSSWNGSTEILRRRELGHAFSKPRRARPGLKTTTTGLVEGKPWARKPTPLVTKPVGPPLALGLRCPRPNPSPPHRCHRTKWPDRPSCPPRR